MFPGLAKDISHYLAIYCLEHLKHLHLYKVIGSIIISNCVKTKDNAQLRLPNKGLTMEGLVVVEY